ncbi:MAG: NAD(P)-dependent alcohol dehydrogenase [Leptospirales bacterium]|nr:NAD(P)-dependent alcohol dehydrogenase [Leptospirales bacterium]
MEINSFAASEKGKPLAAHKYQTQPLAPHECIIKVNACGVCHSDIHMIDNDWTISRYPLVPGHEVIGEVVECGSEVKHIRSGARVGVGWQRSSCLQCSDCLSGNENLCNKNQGVITHGFGGFADHLLMDSRFVFAIPDGAETETSAPLLCGGITVYSALIHAGMKHGQRIGVIGVGGLGHMAIQFASKLGNSVTAFTTSDDKAQFAASLGATEAIVTDGKRPKKRTRQAFDIIISTVAHTQEWSDYVNLLGSDGTLTFVGVPNENLSIPLGLLLGKRRRIMASPIGGRAMITKMLQLTADHGIKAIIEKFPMTRANEAIERVRSNKVRYRAVLTN